MWGRAVALPHFVVIGGRGVVAALVYSGAFVAGVLAAVRVARLAPVPVARDAAGERRRAAAWSREWERRARSGRRSGLFVVVFVVLGTAWHPLVAHADSSFSFDFSSGAYGPFYAGSWAPGGGGLEVQDCGSCNGVAQLLTLNGDPGDDGQAMVVMGAQGGPAGQMAWAGLVTRHGGGAPGWYFGTDNNGKVSVFQGASEGGNGSLQGTEVYTGVTAAPGDQFLEKLTGCDVQFVWNGLQVAEDTSCFSDLDPSSAIGVGILGSQRGCCGWPMGSLWGVGYTTATDLGPSATATANAAATATAGPAVTATAGAQETATAGAGATATAGAIATQTAAPLATVLALGCSIAADGNYVCLPDDAAKATATAVALIPTPGGAPDPELADCLAFAVDLQVCSQPDVPAGEVAELPTVTPTPVPGGAVLLQCWDGSVQYTCPAEPTVIAEPSATPGPAEATATAEAGATVEPTATPVAPTATPDGYGASAAATATAQQAAVLAAVATQAARDAATATVVAIEATATAVAAAVGTANAVSYVQQLQAYETAQAAGAQQTATAGAAATATAGAGATATSQAGATATANAQATVAAGGVLPTATAAGTAAPGGGEPTATPMPWSTPTGPVATAGEDAGKRCSLAAEAAVGVIGQGSIPYCWGGSNPTSTYSVESLCPEGHGMDCSGMVIWSYQQAGANIPRYTAQGIHDNVPANGCSLADMGMRSCWETGDVLFLAHNGDVNDIYHVSMYVGNGLVADCYNTAVGCTIWSPLDKPSYQQDFIAGGRPSEVWGGGACGDEQTGQEPGGGRPGGIATPGMGWPQVNIPAQLRSLLIPSPTDWRGVEASLAGLANYEPIGTLRDLGGFILVAKGEVGGVDTGAGFASTDVSGILAGSIYGPIVGPWTNVVGLQADLISFLAWVADRFDSVPFVGGTLLGFMRTVLTLGLWVGFFVYVRSRFILTS